MNTIKNIIFVFMFLVSISSVIAFTSEQVKQALELDNVIYHEISFELKDEKTLIMKEKTN